MDNSVNIQEDRDRKLLRVTVCGQITPERFISLASHVNVSADEMNCNILWDLRNSALDISPSDLNYVFSSIPEKSKAHPFRFKAAGLVSPSELEEWEAIALQNTQHEWKRKLFVEEADAVEWLGS